MLRLLLLFVDDSDGVATGLLSALELGDLDTNLPCVSRGRNRELLGVARTLLLSLVLLFRYSGAARWFECRSNHHFVVGGSGDA
jgi:hypothetical protein